VKRAGLHLTWLFLLVHVAFPLANALAYRSLADASFCERVGALASDDFARSWLGGLLQRDGMHYLTIARRGYALEEWAFYPLYPGLAWALGHVLGSAVRAGLVVSAVSSAASCVALRRLVALSHGQPAGDRAAALFLMFPTHFFFTAFYTEALFFALVTLSFLAFAEKRLGAAAAWGAFATLTRSSGLLLVPAMLIGALHESRWRRFDRKVLVLTALPLALGAFLVLSKIETGDFLTPFTIQRLWGRKTTFPLLSILQAAQDVRAHPLDWQRDIDCAATLAGFALAARALRRTDAATATFALASLLLPISSGIVISMARFIATIPAVYVVLAVLASTRARFVALSSAFAVAQLGLTVAFGSGRGLV
jgi:Mannosyltransferase (PIG-V)